MTARRLVLRREALSDLTPEDLAGVLAGAQQAITTPVKGCLIQDSRVLCTLNCPTQGTASCAC